MCIERKVRKEGKVNYGQEGKVEYRKESTKVGQERLKREGHIGREGKMGSVR